MSHTKGADGKYHIGGKTYEMLIGTRAQVWHGTAYKTSGGLTKSDLMKNKAGRIVSRSKHSTAKKEMRLLKHGYGTKKGKFGYVKVGSRKARRSRSQRGGMMSLSPADVNAPSTIADVVPQVFSPLDRALTGGRRRSRSARRSRSQRGGSGMTSLSPADVSSPTTIADVVPQVFSPLDRALTGGRRRSRSASRSRAARRSRAAARARSARRSRGASRARSLALRGGTADRRSFGVPVMPSGPTVSALRA
jgi:hypothetical protein